MADNSENNKRIARNTMYLYVQMIVQLLVGLLTARVVFNTLGIVDYGIYSVVGEVMGVLYILNSLESATMRFITFEQGRNCTLERLHTVYSTASYVHLVIAAIVFVLAETVGLYYVMNVMSIPAERLTAAVIIYQFSIVTTILAILCAPYDALIVAHEKMGVFASIGIYNVLVNLIIVFLVKYTKTDKLILYAALMLLIQISMRAIYGIYCNRHFKETHGKWVFDKKLFVEMFKFGGWAFNGTLAAVAYTRGVNLLLNYVLKTTVINAAYGIASTVQNKVFTFAENFLTAVKPQIVKSYAAGDYAYMHRLVLTSSRFSVLLLFFLSMPVLLETYYILFIWLGDVPEYTVWFVRLSLLMMLIDTLGRVMCMAIHATGKIAKFQMIEANLLLLILPLAYIALKMGYSPLSVFIVQLVMFAITQVVRIFIVCPAIKLSIIKYFNEAVFRPLITMIVSSIIPILVHLFSGLEEHPLTQVFVVTIVSLVSAGLGIYYIGCDAEMRTMLKEKIQSKLKGL